MLEEECDDGVEEYVRGMANICENGKMVVCDLLKDISKSAIIELTNKFKTVISKDPGKCTIGKHIKNIVQKWLSALRILAGRIVRPQ